MPPSGPGFAETFDGDPASRWRFFTDAVMGGRSEGAVVFHRNPGCVFARMTGQVSTARNGGFIQMQRRLEGALPAGLAQVRLRVRGNNQRYFVHLRSEQAHQPTAFYRASFLAGHDWHEIVIGFDQFTPSNIALPARIGSAEVASIAVVAYGRDHAASVSVSEITID